MFRKITQVAKKKKTASRAAKKLDFFSTCDVFQRIFVCCCELSLTRDFLFISSSESVKEVGCKYTIATARRWERTGRYCCHTVPPWIPESVEGHSCPNAGLLQSLSKGYCCSTGCQATGHPNTSNPAAGHTTVS